MNSRESLLENLTPEIESYFEDKEQKFDSDNPSVPLTHAPYGSKEVIEALESLLSTYVTMGNKVESFEEKWSNYLSIENSVMVNSGSSANLLAMKAIEDELDENSEVLIPAVCWSTAVFPVVDIGAKPVLVDVDSEDLAVDIESMKSAINENTDAMILIHLLGIPADMDSIVKICEENDIKLIEDCAEAHGAKYRGEYVGTFGEISTFSFSFSHHLTTTEGGVASTNSERYANKMSMMRSWGRIRGTDMSWEGEDFDLDVTFASHGYNVRPTEIQGAFGIHQIPKLEEFVEKRRENARFLSQKFQDIPDLTVIEEKERVRSSYLHYPLILSKDSGCNREDFIDYLEENGIETRTLLSGNIAKHPALQDIEYKVSGELTGAQHIHENGLYISCHHYLTREHLEYVAEKVNSFFS